MSIGAIAPLPFRELPGLRYRATPEEAQARGIANGARVRIENSTGAITLRLSVSADVPRGVLLAHKSRWAANGVESNVNALNPGRKADLAESCAVHSINVSVVLA